MTVVTNFNLPAYLGSWYEIQRYESEFSLDLDCVTAEYILPNATSTRIIVLNRGLLLNNQNETTAFEARGVAEPSFPDDETVPAKLSVAFFGQEPDRSNYWVLGTDYSSYAVVWSCEQNQPDSHLETAWVLSRTSTLTAAASEAVDVILWSNGVPTEDFRRTEQGEICSSGIIPF